MLKRKLVLLAVIGCGAALSAHAALSPAVTVAITALQDALLQLFKALTLVGVTVLGAAWVAHWFAYASGITMEKSAYRWWRGVGRK